MYASEIAARAGVTPDTVRYYSKVGMLAPHQNPDNAYYEYSRQDLERLCFIRVAKNLGFTLADIRAIFGDAERGASPCPRVRSLIEKRRQETERKVAALTAQRNHMRDAIAHWTALPDSQPDGHSVCALIEALGQVRDE